MLGNPMRLAAIAIILLCAIIAPAQGDVKLEKVTYLNLPNCYKLSNDQVEVIVTTDVGPRIIRYALTGGENILAEMPDAVVKSELGEWKPLGGHRLWTAPEAWPRSYVPDSKPVEFKQEGPGTVRLTQSADAVTGIQKEMLIQLQATGTEVSVTHRLTNKNHWAVDLATWGLTIMSGGGTTILPQEPYVSHDDVQNGLLPARQLVMWPYTDFSDTRWALGKRYIRLSCNEKITEPQKAGILNKVGWAAYTVKEQLFVKRFGHVAGLPYPDMGCNNETYTSANFMELETCGPMRHLNWGETAEHTERWRLFKGVKIGDTEATLDAAISPLIATFPAHR